MWRGKVFHENLDSFLAIAGELQLKGLMGRADANQVLPKETFQIPAAVRKEKQVHKKEGGVLKSSGLSRSSLGEQFNDLGGTVALTSPFSED